MKIQLRKKLLDKRKSIELKEKKDNSITQNLVESQAFINAQTVLFYASLDDEISTDRAIQFALDCGKKVALPVCTDKNGSMDFYYISSLDDLITGSFNVREPDVRRCTKYSPSDNAICIVPAIAYDRSGYRLGYGKGYYDRFLAQNNIYKAGLCYNDLIVDNLPINEYDIAVNLIITENGYIQIEK